jgi:hypothetical protein
VCCIIIYVSVCMCARIYGSMQTHTRCMQTHAQHYFKPTHTHIPQTHTQRPQTHTQRPQTHTQLPVIVRSSRKLTLILGLGVSSGGGGAGGTLGGTSQHCLQRQNVYFCTSKASKASNLQLQTAAQDLNALPRSLTYHSLR